MQKGFTFSSLRDWKNEFKSSTRDMRVYESLSDEDEEGNRRIEEHVDDQDEADRHGVPC